MLDVDDGNVSPLDNAWTTVETDLSWYKKEDLN